MNKLYQLKSSCGKYTGTTCFYRNQPLHHAVFEWFRKLKNDPTAPLHAMVMGCSIGCEAESFQDNSYRAGQVVFVRGVDPCEEFIERAKEGWFAGNEVPSFTPCVFGSVSKGNVLYEVGSVLDTSPRTEQDVVFACNLFPYVPKEQHKAAVEAIASYNTGLLAITDVEESILVEAGYHKYLPYAEYIKEGWQHVTDDVKKQHVLWEKDSCLK